MNSLNGGYAMIKYNSTQEELQIAYRSKKPVLCYDENRRAHWAVIEETATESVDEETQEPITIYEYSYRLIDEASGGSKIYRHVINLFISADLGTVSFSIENHSNEPFAVATLHDFFVEKGYTYSNNDYLNAVQLSLGSFNYFCNGICALSGANHQNRFYYKCLLFNSGTLDLTESIATPMTITDIITEV